MAMAVTLTIILFLLNVWSGVVLGQDPLLMPTGLQPLCEGENITFTCTPDSGGSVWTIRGLDGVSDITQATAFGLNSMTRFSSPDDRAFTRPSELTILNLVPEDTGATVQCTGVVSGSETGSQIATIAVGPPQCSYELYRIEIDNGRSYNVCRNATTCSRPVTYFSVTFTNNNVESSSNETVDQMCYTPPEQCKDYNTTVIPYNGCGAGSDTAVLPSSNSYSIDKLAVEFKYVLPNKDSEPLMICCEKPSLCSELFVDFTCNFESPELDRVNLSNDGLCATFSTIGYTDVFTINVTLLNTMGEPVATRVYTGDLSTTAPPATLSTGATIGIAVGVVIGVVIVAAVVILILFFCYCFKLACFGGTSRKAANTRSQGNKTEEYAQVDKNKTTKQDQNIEYADLKFSESERTKPPTRTKKETEDVEYALVAQQKSASTESAENGK